MAHIARHGITPQEAEEAISIAPIYVTRQYYEGEERFLQLGVTAASKVSVVITTWREDLIRVVSAYKAPASLQRQYWEERKREYGSRQNYSTTPLRRRRGRIGLVGCESGLRSTGAPTGKNEGRLGHGSVMRQAGQRGAATGRVVELDETDITLANKLAERKGVERQAYLKELVHSALLKEAEALDQSPAA